MAQKHVVIVGCGWLGTHLVSYLVRREHTVCATSRSEDNLIALDALGAQTVQFDLLHATADECTALVAEAEHVIVSVPTSKSDLPLYYNGLSRLLLACERASVKQLHYWSTTAVYASNNKRVEESSQELSDGPRAVPRIKAEEIVCSSTKVKGIVFRLAGLVGPDRHPIHFLAGKTELSNPDAKVNLIHSEDICTATLLIFEQKSAVGVYNLCCDEHPTRKALYSHAAKQLNLPLPQFKQEEGAAFKVVDNSKIKRDLNWKLKYPDPFQFV